MVKESMDLLELLRKSGVDGDVDFLREALRVLMDAIMDAEVSARIGAEHGERWLAFLRSLSARGVPIGLHTERRWSFAYRSSGKGATSRVFLSRGVEARRRCWR